MERKYVVYNTKKGDCPNDVWCQLTEEEKVLWLYIFDVLRYQPFFLPDGMHPAKGDITEMARRVATQMMWINRRLTKEKEDGVVHKGQLKVPIDKIPTVTTVPEEAPVEVEDVEEEDFEEDN